MEDINFTSGHAPRLRLERDGLTGIDVDFFAAQDGKHLAGRHLSEKDVKDLVEFLAPAALADATATERVTVKLWRHFQPGDVVVERNGGDVVVERQVPAKPAEPEFGHGTAYVFGMVSQGVPQDRVRGILSRTGTFTFLNIDGVARVAYQSMFDGFRLDED